MATLTAPTAATLTYEAYMAEPETEGRYDIVQGVRIFMAGGTWRYQRAAKRVEQAFDRFEEGAGIGLNVTAPFDVLIRRFPRLQTRQPDVLFVSHLRLAQGGGIPEVGPLEVAPELVVEIVSNSETQRILNDKIADYVDVGVDECWVVRPDDRTVEVLTLTADGARSVRVYGDGEAIVSVVFPTLSVPVADVLAP